MAPLSSADAAGEEPAVAARELPRVALPLLDEVDRLHVVVGVEEDRRLAGCFEPLAVGVRQGAADSQHLDVVQPRVPHLVAGELRGAVDLRPGVRRRC